MKGMPVRLALAGVVMIFGGEGFCILGPPRYERIIHIVCHTIFYGGVALVAIAAVMSFGFNRRIRERK